MRRRGRRSGRPVVVAFAMRAMPTSRGTFSSTPSYMSMALTELQLLALPPLLAGERPAGSPKCSSITLSTSSTNCPCSRSPSSMMPTSFSNSASSRPRAAATRRRRSAAAHAGALHHPALVLASSPPERHLGDPQRDEQLGNSRASPGSPPPSAPEERRGGRLGEERRAVWVAAARLVGEGEGGVEVWTCTPV